MDQVVVTVDTLLGQWVVEKRVKELIMGKKSMAKGVGGSKWKVCSIDLKEDVFEGLKLARGNILDPNFDEKGQTKDEVTEFQGPVWSEQEKSLYIGQFDHGIRSGFGLQVNFSGQKLGFVYEGYFKNDKPNGRGRAIYSNGDWYIGQFQEGKATVRGKYRNNASRCTLEGEFLDDKPHGYAVEKWDDGSVFEGHFSNGVKQGKGKFMTPFGVLQGEFQNGEFHGEGFMKTKTSRIYEGSWQESMLVSPAKIKYEETYYEGQINLEFLPEGQGMVVNSKQKIQGVFKNGKIHGQANGTDLQSGKSYVGYYENGILESAIHGESGFSEHKTQEYRPVDPKAPVLSSIVHKEGKPVLAPNSRQDPAKKKGFFCCC